MVEKLHRPPGLVNDLSNDENKKKWSRTVSGYMRTAPISPTATPQFYDATKVANERDVETAVVTWIGFPKQCRWPNDEERWKAADESRHVQDEYLEWSVERNRAGKITRIVFLTEGHQYFQCLAMYQPQTLLALYRELNHDAHIVETDLFSELESKKGTSNKRIYKRENDWNNSTKPGAIVNLIHGSNTLSAEVILAGGATIVRKRADGTIITDARELIDCSNFRLSSRTSDPHIGICCNNLVRQLPRRLTINDPVGLYIHSVSWGMVEPPEGKNDDPSTFWKWTRGSESLGLYVRAEFEVPDDKGYVVGDLLVNGRPLKYAAQLADYIFVSITARTSAWDGTAEPQPCTRA